MKTAELTELERLKLENARLKESLKKKSADFTIKKAPKGGFSVYGLGSRFPTTLYKEGWATLLKPQHIQMICDYILEETGEDIVKNSE